MSATNSWWRQSADASAVRVAATARVLSCTFGGRLHAELTRLGRYPLLVIDQVDYIPFEAEAANLFFQLVASRYERASVIVTSNPSVVGARSSATPWWPPP